MTRELFIIQRIPLMLYSSRWQLSTYTYMHHILVYTQQKERSLCRAVSAVAHRFGTHQHNETWTSGLVAPNSEVSFLTSISRTHRLLDVYNTWQTAFSRDSRSYGFFTVADASYWKRHTDKHTLNDVCFNAERLNKYFTSTICRWRCEFATLNLAVLSQRQQRRRTSASE